MVPGCPAINKTQKASRPAGVMGGGEVGAAMKLESVGAAGEASSGGWEAEEEEVERPASAATSSSTSMLDMLCTGR